MYCIVKYWCEETSLQNIHTKKSPHQIFNVFTYFEYDFIFRQMKLDLDTYAQSVGKISEEAKKVGGPQQDTGAVCQICHKTKFADGVGHKCHYCQLRSCARCGGRIALKQKVCYFL